MSHTINSSPLVLSEHNYDSINNNIGFKFPKFQTLTQEIHQGCHYNTCRLLP
ncbi:hypothetical protein CsSME_00029655 [Camellia sinensis var. sinensis]